MTTLPPFAAAVTKCHKICIEETALDFWIPLEKWFEYFDSAVAELNEHGCFKTNKPHENAHLQQITKQHKAVLRLLKQIDDLGSGCVAATV